jgi:hypothetical protein
MNNKVGIVMVLSLATFAALDSVLTDSLGFETNWTVHLLYGAIAGSLIYLAQKTEKAQNTLITLLSFCLCGLVLWRWM